MKSVLSPQHLLDGADRVAGQILAEHQTVLERLTDALVQRETIDRSELERIAGAKEVPVMSGSEAPTPTRVMTAGRTPDQT